MKIQINQQTFDVMLEDNDTAKALVEFLPLTIKMNELNGNEKYFCLSKSLPSKPQKIGQIKAGDVMLYGNDCLVVFYKSFSSGYAYTKIGHIENVENLQKALDRGSVLTTWSK